LKTLPATPAPLTPFSVFISPDVRDGTALPRRVMPFDPRTAHVPLTIHATTVARPPRRHAIA